MFTSSLKFYENCRFNDLDREKIGKIFLGNELWVMEHERKVEINGIFSMKDILSLGDTGGCGADILYDFKGDISMVFLDYSVKIYEKTFTREIPYYYVAVIFDNLKFKIQGEITFKVGVLNTDTLKVIVRSTPVQIPFTDKYFLRYASGFCIIYEDSENLSKIIKVQKTWRKYFNFKKYLKSHDFVSWFYAPENFGGYKTKLKLLKQISLI